MLTIFTATDGRPEAFRLLLRHLAAQDYGGPASWYVAGSDLAGYPVAEAVEASAARGWDATFVRSAPSRPPGGGMIRNLRAAFEAAGDAEKLVFLEDDDFVAPGFLSAYAAALDGCPMVGAPHARYYNVRSRRWRRMANAGHASLAQTGLAGDAVGHAVSILACRPRALQYDREVWRRWSGPKRLDPALSPLHVSVKGLPGTPGYGVGHRDTFGTPDADLAVFREWGLPDCYLKYGEGP